MASNTNSTCRKRSLCEKTPEEENAASLTVHADGTITIEANIDNIRKLLSSTSLRNSLDGISQQVHPQEPSAASQSQYIDNAMKYNTLAQSVASAASSMFRQPSTEPVFEQNFSPTRAKLGGHIADRCKETVTANRTTTPQFPIRIKQEGSTAEQAPDRARSPPIDESNYLERLGLFNNNLWPNLTRFDCSRCSASVDDFLGVIIKNCQIHKFCKDCLKKRVLDSPFREVTCPMYEECQSTLMESEILELFIGQEEEKKFYLQKPDRVNAENDISLLKDHLTEYDLVPNVVPFECPVCLETFSPLTGVVPKNCGKHPICRLCLQGAINSSHIAKVQCPAPDCLANLEDWEVRLLATREEHEALIQKGLKDTLDRAIQCKTPNCKGIWLGSSENADVYNCPECGKINSTLGEQVDSD